MTLKEAAAALGVAAVTLRLQIRSERKRRRTSTPSCCGPAQSEGRTNRLVEFECPSCEAERPPEFRRMVIHPMECTTHMTEVWT